MEGHTSEVVTLVYPLDGTRLASVESEELVCIWDISDGLCVSKLTSRGPVAFSPNNRHIAVCNQSTPNTLSLWDILTTTDD